MLRHSPRLISNGYYDPNDYTIRRISYKETPVRIFKKRKQKRRLGRACCNLTSEISMCDFKSLETYVPVFMSEPSPLPASPSSRNCRWFCNYVLVVRVVTSSSFVRNVLLTVVLIVLGFGGVWWFTYTRAGPDPHVIQAIRHQNLQYENMFRVMKQIIIMHKMEKEEVEEMIHKALSRHRADDIGMADYALESLGTIVIDSTETYKTRYCTLFGFSIYCGNNGPETVLQPYVQAGKCWGFRGSQGHLVVLLGYPVRITHVTLEHQPRVLSPTGDIKSAPRDFAVFGMVNEQDKGKLLGIFNYDQDGEPVQTFELDSPSDMYNLVKLKILSNWGHPVYTCVYRFRVHSQPKV